MRSLVAICGSVAACVTMMAFAAVMVAQRDQGDHWARSFREGAGVRIVATLAIVGAVVCLSIAGLLNESLIALLGSIAGLTLGGAVTEKMKTKTKTNGSISAG